ncbi:uncharacterized protein LOC135470633 [Liolophura sinensis]|uniref:uncharacterized protein LOC135470633 n=1 Tax=Liolophura sinensis TaxID=3198878 RepID=UPI0031589B6C
MADSSTEKERMCCSATCFTLFIVISLFTHISEVFLNAVYIFYVYTDTVNPEWTATTLGFLLLPIVVTQLFSALLHLQWRVAQSKDGGGRIQNILPVALLHVVQLGFVWRHLRILNERNPVHRKKFLVDVLLLRLVFAFTSSLPLLLLQTHYILTHQPFHGIQLAAMLVCLLSTSWALASYRRQHEFCDIDKVILTWPGTIFRWLWRMGEVTSRILSLAVFATTYHYWTFLVLGLHWTTMLICIWATILGTVHRKDFNRASHALICVAIGYVYTFAHLNFSNHRARCRYVTYYSIIFLEICVLVAAWLLSNTSWRTNIISYYLIAVIGSAFVLSVISMSVYYGCFHIPISSVPKGNSDVCIHDGCINCKLSLCTKHSKVLQRPFNPGWTSQYQAAVYDGHYYKHVLQDSLLDSASELDDRFRGNTSFNDREVEMIMKSGSDSVTSVGHNRKVTVEIVASSSHGNPNGEDDVKTDCPASKSKTTNTEVTRTTASATSTLKSSLDLYNNLNCTQLEKSFDASTLLKSKALRKAESLSSALLHLDSENSESGMSQHNLRDYNLTVSSVGLSLKRNSDCGKQTHPKAKNRVLKSDDSNLWDNSVEDNNAEDVVSKRQSPESSTTGEISVVVSDVLTEVFDECGEQPVDGGAHHSRSPLTTDVSSYICETDSDDNPEMII